VRTFRIVGHHFTLDEHIETCGRTLRAVVPTKNSVLIDPIELVGPQAIACGSHVRDHSLTVLFPSPRFQHSRGTPSRGPRPPLSASRPSAFTHQSRPNRSADRRLLAERYVCSRSFVVTESESLIVVEDCSADKPATRPYRTGWGARDLWRWPTSDRTRQLCWRARKPGLPRCTPQGKRDELGDLPSRADPQLFTQTTTL